PDEYDRHRNRLRDAPARRAAHVFSEIERVARGVDAWRAGDLDGFGTLMSASGQSSIVNYESGSPPLIALYRILIETDGVVGARFSGAGFRGCCVALVRPEQASRVEAEVLRRYRDRFPELAAGSAVVQCGTADGAAVVDVDQGER